MKACWYIIVIIINIHCDCASLRIHIGKTITDCHHSQSTGSRMITDLPHQAVWVTFPSPKNDVGFKLTQDSKLHRAIPWFDLAWHRKFALLGEGRIWRAPCHLQLLMHYFLQLNDFAHIECDATRENEGLRAGTCGTCKRKAAHRCLWTTVCNVHIQITCRNVCPSRRFGFVICLNLFHFEGEVRLFSATFMYTILHVYV